MKIRTNGISASANEMCFCLSKWPFVIQLSGDLCSVLGIQKCICHQKYSFFLDPPKPSGLSSNVSVDWPLLGYSLSLTYKTGNKGTHLGPCQTNFLAVFSHCHDVRMNTVYLLGTFLILAVSSLKMNAILNTTDRGSEPLSKVVLVFHLPVYHSSACPYCPSPVLQLSWTNPDQAVYYP